MPTHNPILSIHSNWKFPLKGITFNKYSSKYIKTHQQLCNQIPRQAISFFLKRKLGELTWLHLKFKCGVYVIYHHSVEIKAYPMAECQYEWWYTVSLSLVESLSPWSIDSNWQKKCTRNLTQLKKAPKSNAHVN